MKKKRAKKKEKTEVELAELDEAEVVDFAFVDRPYELLCRVWGLGFRV